MPNEPPQLSRSQEQEQDQLEREQRRAAADTLISLKSHPGWKILMAALQQEIDVRMIELVDADPRDAPTIASLQAEIKSRTSVPDVVEQLIQQGVEDETLAEIAVEADEADDEG